MRLCVPCIFLLIGCAEQTPPVAACGDSGEELVLLARALSFGRERPEGVSAGFDLDGRVSDSSDELSCGGADLVGPDGTPGIDNALSQLLPVLELTEASVLEPLIQDSINNGALLLLAGISGLDDPSDDDCVDVSVFKGLGVPMLGADGWLLPNQTLRIDEGTLGNQAPEARIREGELLAGPIAEVALPIQVLDLNDTMIIHEAQLGLHLDDDGVWRGALGGGLDIDMLIETASLQNVDPAVVAAVGPVLERLADLAPDDQGVCQQLSATFEVEMVPAFLYEGG